MKYDNESWFSAVSNGACQNLVKRLSFLDTNRLRISRRVVQILVNRNFKQILQVARQSRGKSAPILMSDLENAICSISNIKLVQFFISFYIYWLGGFFLFIYASLLNRDENKKLLLINSPIETYSEENFLLDFFRLNILPLIYDINSDYKIIALATKDENVNPSLTKTTNVIWASFKSTRLNFKDFYVFTRTQLFILLNFSRLVLKNRLVILTYKDFILYSYVETMAQKGKILGYFKSNSESTDQEFWLENKDKKFSFYYFWYSLNSETFKYKGLDKVEHFVRYISYFEDSFTWSEPHKEWLKSLSSQRIFIVPPIVLSPSRTPFKLPDAYIMIFDVVPFVKEALSSMFFDYETPYYSEENCISFLRGIISSTAHLGQSVKLILKTKRGMKPNHSRRYFDYIENETDIIIIPPEVSAVDLIKKSKIVISMPYTSTNFIANYYNIPSLYYDPTNTLDYTYDQNTTGIGFAQNEHELLTSINKVLDQKNINPGQ